MMIGNKKLDDIIKKYPGDTKVEDIITSETKMSLSVRTITRLVALTVKLDKENAQLRAKIEELENDNR